MSDPKVLILVLAGYRKERRDRGRNYEAADNDYRWAQPRRHLLATRAAVSAERERKLGQLPDVGEIKAPVKFGGCLESQAGDYGIESSARRVRYSGGLFADAESTGW